MCRYAFVNYKQRYACFSCRKSFKKITFDDYLEQQGKKALFKKLRICRKKSERIDLEQHYNTTMNEIISKYHELINKCPDCGKLMANMGMDFKSPKKNDTKNWKIIEGMYRIGAIFQTCGCNGFGYVPKTKSDYIEYLKNKIKEYQERYKQVGLNVSLSAFQRKDQAEYWSKNIKKVDIELQNNT